MDRESILEHMARTLFVSAHAGACEDREAFPDFDPRDQIASGGEDWFDVVTDPTPPQAEAKAREIAEDFEQPFGSLADQAYTLSYVHDARNLAGWVRYEDVGEMTKEEFKERKESAPAFDSNALLIQKIQQI